MPPPSDPWASIGSQGYEDEAPAPAPVAPPAAPRRASSPWDAIGETSEPVATEDESFLVDRVARPLLGSIVSAFGSSVEGLSTFNAATSPLGILPTTGERGREIQAAGQEVAGDAEGVAPMIAGAVGSTVGGMPLMPFMVFDENFKAAKRNGATDNEAVIAALPGTAVNTALEAFSLGKGFKAIKALGRLPEGGFKKAVEFAFQLLQTGATEGITEGLQQTVTNIVGRNYNPLTNEFSLEGALDDVGKSTALGGAVGIILPGIGGGVNAAFQMVGRPRVETKTTGPTTEAAQDVVGAAAGVEQAATPISDAATAQARAEAQAAQEAAWEAVTAEQPPAGSPGSPTGIGPIDPTVEAAEAQVADLEAAKQRASAPPPLDTDTGIAIERDFAPTPAEQALARLEAAQQAAWEALDEMGREDPTRGEQQTIAAAEDMAAELSAAEHAATEAKKEAGIERIIGLGVEPAKGPDPAEMARLEAEAAQAAAGRAVAEMRLEAEAEAARGTPEDTVLDYENRIRSVRRELRGQARRTPDASVVEYIAKRRRELLAQEAFGPGGLESADPAGRKAFEETLAAQEAWDTKNAKAVKAVEAAQRKYDELSAEAEVPFDIPGDRDIAAELEAAAKAYEKARAKLAKAGPRPKLPTLRQPSGRKLPTLLARVRQEGGLDADSVRATWNWKGDIIETGLNKSRIFKPRKPGTPKTAMDLDEMAERLAQTGDVPDGTTGDELLQMLKERRPSALGAAMSADILYEEQVFAEGISAERQYLDELEKAAKKRPTWTLGELQRGTADVDITDDAVATAEAWVADVEAARARAARSQLENEMVAAVDAIREENDQIRAALEAFERADAMIAEINDRKRQVLTEQANAEQERAANETARAARLRDEDLRAMAEARGVINEIEDRVRRVRAEAEEQAVEEATPLIRAQNEYLSTDARRSGVIANNGGGTPAGKVAANPTSPAVSPDAIAGMGNGEAKALLGFMPVFSEAYRGAVGSGPAEMARSIAGTPNRLAGDVIRFYHARLIDRVGKSQTDIGPLVAYMAERVADTHRKIVGLWQIPISEYQKMIDGKGLNPKKALEKRRAFAHLTKLVAAPDGKSSDYVFQLAVENPDLDSRTVRSETLSDYEMAVVKKFRELREMTGKYAENMKMLFRLKDGTVVAYTQMFANRLARAYTDQFYEIIRAPGKNAHAYEVLREVLAERNGLTVDDVELALEGIRQEISERRIGTEQARKFRSVPSVIHTAHGNVPILHADPFHAAEAMKHQVAGRMAFMQVFGQGMEAELQKLPNLYEQQGGQRADMVNLIRALQYQPVEDPHNIEAFRPGEIGYQGLRVWNALVGIWKGARLSLSFVPNLWEPFSKVASMVGVRPLLRAYVEAVTSPLTRKGGVTEYDIALEGARDGAHTLDVINWNFDKNFALESIARMAHSILNAPGIRVNEWNEILAYHAALIRVENWRRGQASMFDDARLEFFRFTESERAAILSGKADTDLYRTYLRNVVADTQGTTLHPAEKPLAAHNRVFRFLFPFQAYSQLTMDRLVRAGSVVKQRIMRGAPVSDVVKSAVVLTEMVGGHAVSGALAVLTRALVVGGIIGLRREWEDAWSDWKRFAWDSFQYATGGVLVDALDKVRMGKNIDATVWDLASNTVPLSIYREVRDLWSDDDEGRYAGFEGVEKARQAILRNVTGLRALDSLAAIYGLSSRDGELELAFKSYYRWMERNKGFDKPMSVEATENKAYVEDTEKFRNSMKRAARLIKENAGDEKVTEALLAAVDAGNSPDKIASSLQNRRVLTKVPTELRAKFYAEMPAAEIEKLATYDALLAAWARGVRGK